MMERRHPKLSDGLVTARYGTRMGRVKVCLVRCLNSTPIQMLFRSREGATGLH